MSTFVWNSIESTFDSESAREQFVNTALEDTFFLMKGANVDCDYYLDQSDDDGKYSVSFSYNGYASLKDATKMDGDTNDSSFLSPILDQVALVDGDWKIEESWMDDVSVGKDIYHSDKPYESYHGTWVMSLDTDTPEEVDEFREYLEEEIPYNCEHLLKDISDEDIQGLIDSIGYEEQAYIVDADFPKELDLIGKLVLGDTPVVNASPKP